jgi:hypothetical protein
LIVNFKWFRFRSGIEIRECHVIVNFRNRTPTPRTINSRSLNSLIGISESTIGV